MVEPATTSETVTPATMASPLDNTVSDVPIKHESPYSAGSIPTHSPDSPSLKRRRPSEEVEDGSEKRQRIEPGSAATPKPGPELQHKTEPFDLAALLEQAASSATQGITQSAQNENGPGSELDLYTGEGTPNRQNKVVHLGAMVSDPHLSMRILSLPILESLSTQILSTLAQGPYAETIKIITEPNSEFGQAYQTLKSLFDQTKKIYSQQAPFLSANDLNIQETEHRATIRTTNLATFVSSVFGGQDVGFYELNDHFIETFTPDGQPLEKEPGQLYLNLKTQMYLSAVSQEEQERTKEDILEDLFPLNMNDLLSGRHPDTPLSSTEIAFVNEAQERREYLMNQPSNVDSLQVLSEMYAWEDFLKSLSAHLSTAYEPLIAPFMKRHALTAPASPIRPQQTQRPTIEVDDIVEQAARAAQAALQSVGYGQYTNRSQSNVSQPYQQNTYHSQYSNNGNIPFHTQSAPTQVLYERARQAAVAKANPGQSRRPGLPSQRRPWSGEEENALMAGLDQVKGPHWSQILALYGSKGSVSEILKDRNQVQLKDKARNLKLFFLKSSIEVPYYLQCVTGELKTRAPSQAARKEAEERARLAGEEETARFNGIMTLAGGMLGDGNVNGGEERRSVDRNGNEVTTNTENERLEVQSPESQRAPQHLAQERFSEDEQLRQRLLAANANGGD